MDEDEDGILDEDQFRRLIETMQVVDSQEIDTLLTKVDPFNNQKMTYSEIVHLLSGHMTSKSMTDASQIPILEKFITDGIDEDLEQLPHELHLDSQPKSRQGGQSQMDVDYSQSRPDGSITEHLDDRRQFDD